MLVAMIQGALLGWMLAFYISKKYYDWKYDRAFRR